MVIDSMAEDPVTVPDGMDQAAVQSFIHQTRIAAVPVVDSGGRFLRVEYNRSLYAGSDVPQSCAGYGAAVSDLADRLRSLMRKYIDTLDQTRFARALNRDFLHLARDGRFATAVLAT